MQISGPLALCIICVAYIIAESQQALLIHLENIPISEAKGGHIVIFSSAEFLHICFSP